MMGLNYIFMIVNSYRSYRRKVKKFSKLKKVYSGSTSSTPAPIPQLARLEVMSSSRHVLNDKTLFKVKNPS
jgi:hypothetical protein